MFKFEELLSAEKVMELICFSNYLEDMEFAFFVGGMPNE